MNARCLPGFAPLLLLIALSTQPLTGQDAPPDQTAAAAQDPPSRVGRVAVIEGAVSLEPAGVNQFSQAELNYPLTVGDRLYTDLNGSSALETGGVALRMGNGADLTVSSLTDDVAQFGLAQGSMHVHTRSLVGADGQQGLVEIDTPNGTVLVEREGDLRVDSYPGDDTTVVTVYSGQAEVTGPGFDQQLAPGMSLRLTGAHPTQVEGVQMPQQDALDSFDAQQEQLFLAATDVRNNYVPDEMIGAADLDASGEWAPDPDYGEVWYPTLVAAGWAPYTNGHWAWVAPWGWTWVEAEPWGFAPFHYGRWAVFHGRWGWVPGPPPTIWGQRRPVRPIYSPALVAFVGGPGFSLAVGFGGTPGAGVTAWFPLGPRETYVPWYHASPAYVNRVNVTNLYSRNAPEVRNTYINRTTVVYNTDVTHVSYANRAIATVAIPQHEFAAGVAVNRAQPVRLDASARAQLNQAPILPHPMVTPEPSSAAPQARARALPPNLARPVLETRSGLVRTGSPTAGAAPIVRAPVAPMQTVRPGTPGGQPVERNPVAPPAAAPRPSTPPQQPAARPQTVPPAAPLPHAAAAPYPQPTRPIQPVAAAPSNRTAPLQTVPGRAVATYAPAAAPPVAPARAQPVAVRAPEQERPLVTRTAPQLPQPAFEVQRQAIERNDPGRPLGPQQVNNLRAGRPAGPPAQAEPAHPQGRPAPAPVVPAQRPK